MGNAEINIKLDFTSASCLTSSLYLPSHKASQAISKIFNLPPGTISSSTSTATANICDQNTNRSLDWVIFTATQSTTTTTHFLRTEIRGYGNLNSTNSYQITPGWHILHPPRWWSHCTHTFTTDTSSELGARGEHSPQQREPHVTILPIGVQDQCPRLTKVQHCQELSSSHGVDH